MWRCTRVGPGASHSCFHVAAIVASFDRSSVMTLSIVWASYLSPPLTVYLSLLSLSPSLPPSSPSLCLSPSPLSLSLYQWADNIGIVDCHICLHRQLGTCPQSSRETGERRSCLPNPLVDQCVQWEVVSDGGAEVGELTDSIEFIVIDCNDRRCFCVLSQNIRLIQTDGESEVLMYWHVRGSPTMTGVPPGCGSQTAASPANSMSLVRTVYTFVLVLRRTRLKSLSSDCCVERMF